MTFISKEQFTPEQIVSQAVSLVLSTKSDGSDSVLSKVCESGDEYNKKAQEGND